MHNYKNITKNMTDRLEPVPYESSAYAAHKKVKEILQSKFSEIIAICFPASPSSIRPSPKFITSS